MTLTPHRDAALAAAACLKQHVADRRGSDPIVARGEDMSLAVIEAVMVGTADMMDRAVPHHVAALHANRSLAAALASLLMTLAGGNKPAATELLGGMLVDLDHQVRERIINGAQVVGPRARSPWPAGHA